MDAVIGSARNRVAQNKTEAEKISDWFPAIQQHTPTPPNETSYGRATHSETSSLHPLQFASSAV